MSGWRLVASFALVALVAGAAGGAVATWAGPHGAKAKAGGNPLPRAQAEGLGSDQGERTDAGEEEEEPEAEALRGRMAALERRVSLLTAALARGQQAPGDDAAGPSPREADVADPVFEAAVLDIMDRERERADGERETRRVELRTQRTARVSEGLATNLGLDQGQKQEVADLISSHFDAVRALRSDDNPERPVTPREWREKAAELERTLQARLAEVLSPAQMAAYQALDPEDQISTGFGRPRGRGGPPAQGSASPGSTPR